MSKTNWKLDTSHSEVTFKVKHMMITNVTGSFKEFEATAVMEEEDFTKAEVNFTAKTASVDTNAAQRDTHLRSPEFFDTDKYPELKFKSTSITKIDGNTFKMNGDLTIKDVTKNISVNVEFGGIQKDPYGQIKAGFSITGKFNRKDFGLNWNAALEAGGVMVSDEVRVNCEVQMIRS